jgi:predicted nuclease of predicted toxin-antitoxin system
MLRLLLDEHISSKVAHGLVRLETGIDVDCILTWHGGKFLGAPDVDILSEAYLEERTVVTYDLATMPKAIQDAVAQHGDHASVIFVDTKTLRPNDIGGLVRALQLFLEIHSDSHLHTSQVYFLRTAHK